MEGPTPVSALIHAATMVTAGVYLIARTYPLFELAPTAADVGAIIGTATLVFAATVAVTVTDLKRVIAYSTISQIGYMVLGRLRGRLRRRDVPPDDARLLQGAALHVRRLGDRGDGRQPGPRQDGRLPQGDAVHLRRVPDRGAGARPASRSCPASSRRTRSSPSRINRGGVFVVLGVFGYLAAGLTAFYAFRLVFRVFYGEPVPEAREMEAGGLAHHEPENPLTGEKRGHRRGLPRARAPRGRARAADAGGDGAAGAAGDRRRRARGPGRDRRDRALPRADLRGVALLHDRRPATAPSGSGCWAAGS